jgi:hypothetical protein
MPENPLALHVVGRTGDGRLWHTIRTPGGWTPFGDVLAASGLSALSGEVAGVACARRLMIGTALEEGLYVFMGIARDRPRLLFRSSDTGLWREDAAPAFAPSSRVAVATRGSVGTLTPSSMLHLAAVSNAGVLFAAAQAFDASSPDVPVSVEWSAGERGDLRAVALLSGVAIDSVATMLYAASADGRVYVTFGSSSAWSPFADLDTTSGPGQRPGDVLALAAAQNGTSTEHAIVTGDGHAWIATRFLNGTWARWRDLETYTATFTGGPGVSGTFTASLDVGTFNSIAVATTGEGAHVVGTTTDGRLWHQLRATTMPVFRDVELVGVGQDVGRFTAVATA